jgi:hypothetical protein
MGALFSLRLQRVPALDIASGEHDLPRVSDDGEYFTRASNCDAIVLHGGDHEASMFDHPIRVFVDDKITAEEVFQYIVSI